MTSTPLSRSEAKDLTRRRLIRAAFAILDEEGEAGLTTVKVSKAAGIAQSSFYVHFKDRQELLRALGEQAGERLRGAMREARHRAREVPGDKERHREAFRIPLEAICRHPALFRLGLRARHDPSSPLQEFAVETAAAYRAHLVADLASFGFPTERESDRRRLEMIADGIGALTNAMAIGHIDGRYPDLEEAVDVLVAFSYGYLRLLRKDSSAWSGNPPSTPSDAPPAEVCPEPGESSKKGNL
ncbi:TetR family transcriptional regulator [Streptosporangium amethystogenes]|uniref:TetR family transcriptional regulator n=1 Tax=Streptosporangium amethystogenes TaxID=2002 RepID=UPI00068AC4ED|nr:TetR family transcriptional regulator [Streptosporangium amethystogenes]